MCARPESKPLSQGRFVHLSANEHGVVPLASRQEIEAWIIRAQHCRPEWSPPGRVHRTQVEVILQGRRGCCGGIGG